MNTQEKASWLASLLTGWGIKESWAKIIVGAIMGALAAAGLLTSCTMSLTKNPDGTLSVSGSIYQPAEVKAAK